MCRAEAFSNNPQVRKIREAMRRLPPHPNPLSHHVLRSGSSDGKALSTHHVPGESELAQPAIGLSSPALAPQAGNAF